MKVIQQSGLGYGHGLEGYRFRFVAALTVPVMVVWMLFVPAPPAEAQGSGEFARARDTGRSVEILSQRSETTQVFAEPDGTQRAVITARPTRVRRDSQWVDADANLAVRTDGSLGPRASTIDMRFSRGGEGPLVHIAKDGAWLDYFWPTSLPAPQIQGTVATYRDVIPGVDLKLSADVEGFSQVLVVGSADAAARPELAELRIKTKVGGGTLRADGAGNLSLLTADGQVALHGSAPRMWDSSGKTDDSGSRLSAPMTGDAIGSMAVRLEDGALILTPDQKFLHAPGLTFPLYVDPPMHGATRMAWTHVSKHYLDQSYYGNSGDAKVGYYYDPNVPSGPTSDTYRSFFRMNTSPVNGKHIIKATFRAFETYSFSCSAREVQLWLTGGIGTGTTWRNQPPWSRRIDVNDVAKGYSSSCPDGGVDFDATSAVVEAAGARWPNLTLGLRAASESDKYGWKKFRNNPSLEITYNTTPNVPDQLATMVGASAGLACATGTSTPYATTLTPSLRARVSDADGAKGQTVRAHFEWYVTDGAKLGEAYTSYVASGTPVTATIPSGVLADGARVSWRVRAQDDANVSSSTSGWSSWCSMVVDLSKPADPPVVSSADYPETPAGGDPIPSGGIGRMGVFTFSPGSVTDAGAYLFGLNNDDVGTATVVPAAADGTATVTVTPSRDLLNVMYVWIRDRAGNIGPYKRYEFSVRAGTSPVAHWKLDETTGDTAADSSGNGYHARLIEGAGWTPGRVSGGARFDGNLGQIAPERTEGIVRTDRNFSVAAWVRLGDKNAFHTVLSQDGVLRPFFHFRYNQALDRWEMVTATADSPTPPPYATARSDGPPVVGRWTHLAASFDAGTGLVRLFVDGRPQTATAVNPTPWNAVGQMTIGRVNAYGNPWAGDIDDVRVWDRLIYEDELAGLANRPVVMEGHWRLDETTGAVAADSSGMGRSADASGGYSWTDGWVGGGAGFNGVDGQIVTRAKPVVRTDGSFTVAAWLKVTDKTDHRTAVSQDGVKRSAFYLQYDTNQDRWRFNMPTDDSDSNNYTGPFSIDPAKSGVWTHVAGVYDHARGELKLYVDGDLQATTPFTTPWSSSGPLAIGRALKGWNRWAGQIDDVRVYTGVLTDTEILDLALQ